MTVDGSPLEVQGEVTLVLSRTDGPVSLPRVSSVFLIVADLCSLRTDVIIGHDLIACAGGINLQYKNDILVEVKFGERVASAVAMPTVESDGANSFCNAKVAEVLESRWTKEAARQVAQTESQWRVKHEELKEECERLKEQLTASEEKIGTIKASEGGHERESSALRRQLEEAQERHEKALKSAKEAGQEAARKSEEEAYRRGVIVGKNQARPSAQAPGNTASEIQRVMNNVYHLSNTQFEASQSYTGTHIMKRTIKTIKNVTLSLLQPSTPAKEEYAITEEEDEDNGEEEKEVEERDSSTVSTVGDMVARISDYNGERLASLDEECATAECPYVVGDEVLRIVSPTTVVIEKDDGQNEKVVNTDIIECDVTLRRDEPSHGFENVGCSTSGDDEPVLIRVPLLPPDDQQYAMRDRSGLKAPE